MKESNQNPRTASPVNNLATENSGNSTPLGLTEHAKSIHAAGSMGFAERKNNIVLIVILCICVLAVLFNLLLLRFHTEGFPHSWNMWGGFGGAFGLTNTIISIAALLALIYTFTQQQKAISIQNLGLIHTQNAVELQKLGLEKTEQSIRAQNEGLILTQQAIELQRESLRQAQVAIEHQKSEYEQTVILGSKTALLNAYCQHVQWFLEERAARKEGRPLMTEQQFLVFSRQARAIGEKHWDIIRDMEEAVRKKEKRPSPEVR